MAGRFDRCRRDISRGGATRQSRAVGPLADMIREGAHGAWRLARLRQRQTAGRRPEYGTTRRPKAAAVLVGAAELCDA